MGLAFFPTILHPYLLGYFHHAYISENLQAYKDVWGLKKSLGSEIQNDNYKVNF